MAFRQYQQDAEDAVFINYKDGITRMLGLAAGGLGKTRIAGNVIKRLPSELNCYGRVLWLTHEENLIEQSALSVICNIFPEYEKIVPLIVDEAGGIIKFMSGKHDLFASPECAIVNQLLKSELGIIKQQLFNIQPKLVVASIQTIVNRLDKIPVDHFDAIIIDEAHFAMANSWIKTINHFTPLFILGITATAERLDGLSLGDLFDKIIFDYDVKFGIDNGYLAELEAIVLKTGIDLSKIHTIGGDFNQKELKVVDCPERNDMIVDKWLETAQGRPTMVFCVDVDHAKNMTTAFKQREVKAEFVVSDESICPLKKDHTRNFKAADIDVLVLVQMYIYGFDYPNVGCVIPACPTKSKTKYLQEIFRGTRNKDEQFIARFGSNNCIIIDPTDNSKQHSVINSYTLEGSKRLEERVFMGAARKASLIEQRDKRKLEHTQERTERYNLLSLPQIIVQMNDNREPSPAMMNFLKGLGLYVEGNHYTWGQVSELIGNSPAGRYEMEYAIKHGYDVSGGMTKAVFGKVKMEVLEKLNKQAIAMDTRFKNSPFIGLK